MNKLIKYFTYTPVVNRGLISSKTEKHEFICKLSEEVNEVYEAHTFDNKLSDHEAEEIMDVIFVCLNYLIHYNRSIIKEFFKVYKKNKKRSRCKLRTNINR
ncbi:MAG: hypothetical protein ACOWWH_12500 [Eubacteriaceae bacterium]